MYMLVKCIKSDDTHVLVEDAIYTVDGVTRKGNYILAEANPPEGFNCFDKNRFEIIEISSHEDDLIRDYGFDEDEIDQLFT
jgi:hypothetical protein